MSDEQRTLDDFARGVILPMWVQAVRDGERTVEGAQREVLEPISRMSELERNRSWWRFTQQVLAIKPRKRPGRRTPRALPSAWVKFNYNFVNDLVKHLDLKRLNPDGPCRTPSDRGVFEKAASLWKAHGINVSSYEVMSAYYRAKKK